MRLGVNFALGTDSSVYPHGLNGKEFGYLVDIGMTPAQALLSSSLGSARLLGIDGDTGTLEAGKAADVVAVRGDVLANIHATETPILVMKQGQVVLQRSETPVTAQ
jgi:imidazolonepropionase-like amidohydrolase